MPRGPFWIPLCQRSAILSNSSHPLFVIVVTHLPTSRGWKPEFWLSVPGVEPRTSCTIMHEWTCTHAARVLVLLTNWASQTGPSKVFPLSSNKIAHYDHKFLVTLHYGIQNPLFLLLRLRKECAPGMRLLRDIWRSLRDKVLVRYLSVSNFCFLSHNSVSGSSLQNVLLLNMCHWACGTCYRFQQKNGSLLFQSFLYDKLKWFYDLILILFFFI